MNRRALLVLALLGFVVVIGACMTAQFFVGPVTTGMTERSHASNDLTGQTHTDVFTYTVSERTRDASLHLQLDVMDGEAHWVLTDPEGSTAWEGKLTAGQQLDEARGVYEMMGKWTLELSFEDMTGRYDTLWEGRG